MGTDLRVWGEDASGYLRSETVSCVLLQRRSTAKRVYATVLASGVNNDGYKTGRTAPQQETQELLMTEVIGKAHIDPSQIGYFELHATGTEVILLKGFEFCLSLR